MKRYPFHLKSSRMCMWRVRKSKGKGKCYNYIIISKAKRSNLKRKWSPNIFHVNLLNGCKEHSCLCNYQINGIQSNFGSKIPYSFRACANEKKKKTGSNSIHPACCLLRQSDIACSHLCFPMTYFPHLFGSLQAPRGII